MIILLLVQVF